MKILITGGHYSPAIAVIDKLKNIDIVFVGREYALEQDAEKSLEYKEIIKRKIKFINLDTGKLNREFSIKSLIHFFKISKGFINAFKIIKIEKPDIVLSFGSYIAVPICFISWINKIPIYIHEQTIRPGLSNRILSYISKKIFISFPQTKKYFPKSKVILTGNPIRESILTPYKKIKNIIKDKPIIFITGGSSGSHSINLIVKDIIDELIKKYIIILQTGSTKEFNDFSMFEKIKTSLSNNLRNNFHIFKNLDDNEISYIYSISDLVISRSGANTFFEIVSLKIPSILIPLPWSVKNEQEEHAKIIEESGSGKIFYQNKNTKELVNMIYEMMNNLSVYKENYKNINYLIKKNATEEIIKNISAN